MHTRTTQRLIGTALLLIALASTGLSRNPTAQSQQTAGSYIVQAASSQAAEAAVAAAGGTVGQPLALINAVSAELSPAAVAQLGAASGIVLHADTPVWRSGDGDIKETDTKGYALHPAAATQANTLHQQFVATRQNECKTISETEGMVVQSQSLEQRALQGRGVTVAIVDSGFVELDSTKSWKRNPATGELFMANGGRCVLYRDFLERTAANANSGTLALNSVDQNGHGTHVAATIADSRATKLASNSHDTPVGVAPQANLVVARALDASGAGTYSSVIAAIEWIVQNQQRYDIRVLNLSLYAPVSGPYWADPLNQAVMKAWQAGIVVVVAAGNSGPNAGTITAPGNVPYVITVGALKSGRYTQSGYDELAAYSSRGPTESAFVKPDLLVPASRTIAPMAMNSTLGSTLRSLRSSNKDACTIDSKVVPPDMAITGDTPSYCYENTKLVDFKIGALAQKHAYYQLSGTSMAAAEVSGVAALIIQRNPSLSNDQVKYRLLATARPATVTATGESVYTPWEQGAGLLTIRDAVFTTTLELANQGMDIDLDLDVTSETQIHYWGNTVWNEASGEFSLIDPQTLEPVAVWNGTQRIWGGTQRIWGGTQRIWGGTQRIWGGSDTDQPTADTNQPADDTNQPAPDSTWAGAERIWGGSTSSASPSTATHSETLIED